MSSTMRSMAPDERNTTEPSATEPTIPNASESGEHTITEPAGANESLYGTIESEPLDTPPAPFFTERPQRRSDSPEDIIAPKSTPAIQIREENSRSEYEAVALMALAHNLAFTSIRPDTANEEESGAPLKIILTPAPVDTASTNPDELPPKHE